MVCLLFIAALLSAPADPADDATRLAAGLAKAEKLRCNERWFTENIALARLALKKLRLLQAGGLLLAGDVRPEEILAQGMAALERIHRRSLQPLRRGRLMELAYEASNDGSVQPYYLYLPPNYSADRKWPLIVFLHGYVPTITVLDPWVLPPEQCEIAGRNGCMLLIPYGRRNTDFQGVGEVDVLETTSLVCRHFPVDTDRIYICGVSMGGMGAWNMALRHPGTYAAAAPISGQTDMLTWWGWPKDRVPPFKRWLIEWDNPIDLVENARNQHFFVQHGELDQLIPVEQSRSIVRKALSLGIPIEYYEHKGKSHFIYWENECFERAWRWLPRFKLQSAPERITFVTYTLEYDTAFWARIAAIDQWGKPARIDVRKDRRNQAVRVTAKNVASLALDRETAGLLDSTAFLINGRPMKPTRTQGRWLFFDLKPLAPAHTFPPPKRKGLCGPLEEVFDSPFIVVQGTAGDTASDAALANKVRTWAAEWDAFADGFPRIATDTELTDDQIRRYNLVLFGTPETNSILARIADQLPIKITGQGFAVGDKTFSGAEIGLVMCYPNPLAPDHYVAIYSGPLYGRRLSINHKHDLIPDFLIFRSDQFDYDDTEMWVCAGFFDTRWHLSPQTTWVKPGWSDVR